MACIKLGKKNSKPLASAIMMITRTTVSCFHRETEFIRPLQRTKMFTSKRTLIALGPRRLGSDRENSGCFFSFTVTTSQKIQIFAEEE